MPWTKQEFAKFMNDEFATQLVELRTTSHQRVNEQLFKARIQVDSYFEIRKSSKMSAEEFESCDISNPDDLRKALMDLWQHDDIQELSGLIDGCVEVATQLRGDKDEPNSIPDFVYTMY